MEEKLRRIITDIAPLNERTMAEAADRQNRLTKPTGALGVLEELSIRIAGMTGAARPKLKEKTIFCLAGDHGVAAAGVSAYPAEVTPQMVMNFLAGGAGINVLARQAGARVVVADLGVNFDFPPDMAPVDCKVAKGTKNMAEGPAMTREEAVQSIMAGIELVQGESELDMVGTGDMGIGNTTPSSAITSVVTGRAAEEVTGRGTGLDEAALKAKANVVARSIEINQPDPADGLDVLAKVGGFEIGGIAGVIIGGAARGVPVVIDGFISGAGALIAATLAPRVKDYLIAAHQSVEVGHRSALAWLGLRPLLDLELRLGEGTGAALAMFICQSACAVLDEMATFDEAGVSDKQ